MLKRLNGNITLLGTAHISKESVKAVRAAIESERPDVVAVELDRERYLSLTNRRRWENTTVFRVIREGRTALLLVQVFLGTIQKKLGVKEDIRPGAEMLTAIKAAREKNIPVALVDRDIAVTFKRGWGHMGFFEKIRFFWYGLTALLGGEEGELDDIEMEELLKEDVLTLMIKELKEVAPGITRAFIDERDTYIARKLVALRDGEENGIRTTGPKLRVVKGKRFRRKGPDVEGKGHGMGAAGVPSSGKRSAGDSKGIPGKAVEGHDGGALKEDPEGILDEEGESHDTGGPEGDLIGARAEAGEGHDGGALGDDPGSIPSKAGGSHRGSALKEDPGSIPSKAGGSHRGSALKEDPEGIPDEDEGNGVRGSGRGKDTVFEESEQGGDQVGRPASTERGKTAESDGRKVLAVLGAGHLEGVANNVREGGGGSLEELSEVKKKRVSVGKVLKYAIPALFLFLVAYLLFKGEYRTLGEVFVWWFLINGSFSAVGALLARGHLLSVLTAFLAAPLSSLNPLLAAGWFAGTVEGVLRTPRVTDVMELGNFERFRDFFNNRLIRVLLVAALANLGSMIGTYVATAKIIEIVF